MAEVRGTDTVWWEGGYSLWVGVYSLGAVDPYTAARGSSRGPEKSTEWLS